LADQIDNPIAPSIVADRQRHTRPPDPPLLPHPSLPSRVPSLLHLSFPPLDSSSQQTYWNRGPRPSALALPVLQQCTAQGFSSLRPPPTVFFGRGTRPGLQYNLKPPVGLCHPLSPSALLPPPSQNPHIQVTSHDRPDFRPILAQGPSGRTPKLLPHLPTTRVHLFSPPETVAVLQKTLLLIGTLVAIAADQPSLYGGLPGFCDPSNCTPDHCFIPRHLGAAPSAPGSPLVTIPSDRLHHRPGPAVTYAGSRVQPSRLPPVALLHPPHWPQPSTAFHSRCLPFPGHRPPRGPSLPPNHRPRCGMTTRFPISLQNCWTPHSSTA